MLMRFSLHKKLWKRWIHPLVALMVALGLIVGHVQPTPAFSWLDLIFRGIQIVQLSNVSDRQEVALGSQINQQLLRREVRLYDDPALNDYVDEIGQRLAEVSTRPPSEQFQYTFQVVDDESVNAFATMGGFVYIHTGLLDEAENEAQLASVLAHEIAHVTERHALKQIRQTAIAQGLASAAGLDRNVLVGLGVNLALRLPRSREAELEADQLGLKMLGETGYPQSAMVEFMQKLLKDSSPPEFLSTHPATRDRLAAMEQNFDPAYADNTLGTDEAAYQDFIDAALR